MTFVYAWIVPLWAAQLLPQLLMEQFDTLRIQCRHINICMKEFIIFVCTDSAEIFFSKLRSAGLNYNLPGFFTESYCAGVSNKHCLLTFFIVINFYSRVVIVMKSTVEEGGEERLGGKGNCMILRTLTLFLMHRPV